jgi:hypothetical protein
MEALAALFRAISCAPRDYIHSVTLDSMLPQLIVRVKQAGMTTEQLCSDFSMSPIDGICIVTTSALNPPMEPVAGALEETMDTFNKLAFCGNSDIVGVTLTGARHLVVTTSNTNLTVDHLQKQYQLNSNVPIELTYSETPRPRPGPAEPCVLL